MAAFVYERYKAGQANEPRSRSCVDLQWKVERKHMGAVL